LRHESSLFVRTEGRAQPEPPGIACDPVLARNLTRSRKREEYKASVPHAELGLRHLHFKPADAG